MALGVQPKVSHDISFAVGKGLQGLKVEAMAKDAPRKAARGRTLLESVMLGAVTVAVAAIPVVVTHVPAPESLVAIKDVLQEWCTPSICFGVLIIGVLAVTLGGGAGAEAPATPEESHQKFADSYLTQLGPVAASQIDPLRMPDIFFSPDAARLTHSASFPARGPQSSVMVPVYYPAFMDHPPFPSHAEKEAEFSHGRERFVDRFAPRLGDRFSPRIDDRFSPSVDDRFSPRVDDRFSPRVEEWFSPKVENRFGPQLENRFGPQLENRFGPRVEERFSPRVEDRFGPKMDDRYAPERYAPPLVEERYVPQVEERYEPQVEERYVPQVEERYIPQVEERYLPQVEERYIPQVEERYEPQEHDRFEEEDAYEPEEVAMYGAHIESRAHSENGHRYAHAESDREDEVEYIESEADDEEVEPEPEPQIDSEPQQAEPPHVPVVPETLPSPPHSPIAPEAASSSLLSGRKPPTVPAPVIVQTAPPPPPPPPPAEVSSPPEPKVVSPPEPKVASPPPQPETSVREAPEMSPSTPPKHSSERRRSSRSYGEFVRSTIDCPLPTLKTPSKAPLPKVASSPSPAAETLDEKLARMKSRRFSTGGISLPPAPNKRPREVRVVDDDKELDVDPGLEGDDDVDQRVEAFLRNFREQMRLQRQESLHRHRRGSDLAKP